jgi:acyl-CoA synthetase (AMP-forming)/AMP-acid ligase II
VDELAAEEKERGTVSTLFDLSTIFRTVAGVVPDQEAVVWRDRRLTYGAMDARIDGFASYLVTAGTGCHTERGDLANHESGQDHLGLYLRNGNEYLEAMIGSYRARVAPFNVSYRYVEEELVYLLNDAKARALVYNAEFAPNVADIVARLPHLELLIQVADESGNELLPGAVDYESIIATPPPASGMPTPSPDDLYILYTGGTTGMPKGVLWRQHDIFISSMGGRPFTSDRPMDSYDELAEQVRSSAGAMSILMVPPFIHGAAQWGAYHAVAMGGRIVIPDDVDRLRPDAVMSLVEREKVLSITTVGDAIVRDRLLAALPHLMVVDGVGASESGMQMSNVMTAKSAAKQPPKATAVFAPQSDTAVVAIDLDSVLQPGEGEGWLARRAYVPLGYLGDEEKTSRTFPTIDGVRWSVPGDRAIAKADGRIELLGRDSMTINSGGEKIFAEEVERAVGAHPDVYDVVVVGRPSKRWGSEVVAVVQPADGRSPTDGELAAVCAGQIARYKIPKAFIRTQKIMRSPAGKADYRWAKQMAAESLSPSADSAAV